MKRTIKEILRDIPGARSGWHLVKRLQISARLLVLALVQRLRAVKYRKIVRLMITGTKGKTTTTTMVARIMEESGHCVGYCTTDDVVIGGRVVRVGDSAGQMGARPILEDPTVTCAVLETARGDLGKRGLYVASCHAAALLNIGWDHVGTDGIDTQEEMLALKRRVTDASRGPVVLNAEDPLLAPLVQDYGVKRTTFFALDPAAVAGHLAAGGEAVTLTEGADPRIVHRGPAGDVEILPVAEIPASMGGRVPFIVANALASAALTRAVGVTPEAIATALRRFGSSSNALTGRFNVISGYSFNIVIDRSHNPSSLAGFVSGLAAFDRTGKLHMMMTAVGNRPDWSFEQMAEIAASLSAANYVLYDGDILRRSRKPGEIPRLLSAGLMANAVPAECISQICDVREAVRKMVADARPGDLLCFLGEHPKQNLAAIVVEELERAGYKSEVRQSAADEGLETA